METTALDRSTQITERERPESCSWPHPESQVYAELELYVEENNGVLERLTKKEFMSRPVLMCDGEMSHMIAERIFEDWVDKKINGLLREDPGF